MVFQKGVSGNPSGKDRLEKMAAIKVRGMTLKAIDRLGEMMVDADPKVALPACKEILERSLGRARQSVSVDVQHSLSQQHLAALKLINERARISQNELIDVTPAHDSSPQLAPTIAPKTDAHD